MIKNDNMQEPNSGLISFIYVIFIISISIFLENFFELRKLIPHVFDTVLYILVFLEISAVYLTVFFIIIKSNGNSNKKNVKLIPNRIILVAISIFLIMIGGSELSFKFIHLSSYTIILLVFVYDILNRDPRDLNKCLISFLFLFFMSSLIVIGYIGECSVLHSVSEPEITEGEHMTRIDLGTTILQEDGNSIDICIEMNLPGGYIKGNGESIKIINFLKENDKSTLQWSVIFPYKSERYILYLSISSNLGENQYRVDVYKDGNKWHSDFTELSFP